VIFSLIEVYDGVEKQNRRKHTLLERSSLFIENTNGYGLWVM